MNCNYCNKSFKSNKTLSFHNMCPSKNCVAIRATLPDYCSHCKNISKNNLDTHILSCIPYLQYKVEQTNSIAEELESLKLKYYQLGDSNNIIQDLQNTIKEKNLEIQLLREFLQNKLSK